MSKREKIILGVTLLVVIYGGYSFFFEPSSRPRPSATPAGTGDLNQFVAAVAAKLPKKEAIDSHLSVIRSASASWEKDPFLKLKEPKKGREGTQMEAQISPATALSYSGYVEMGGRRLAIINGMEYAVGDLLGYGDYVIQSISPAQVVVGIKGASTSTVLKLEEAP